MERYSWGEPNIIMWSGIGISFKLGPVIFQNIGQCRGNGVLGALYIHQVLRPHMVTFIARHRNYTFQHDNIRAHFARATSDFLQQNDMDVMPWSALSPCLHLTEHLCSDIQRLLEFQSMPTTTAELGESLFMVWTGIPFINHLIHSMARGCAAVIHATAGNTRCLLPFLFLLKLVMYC